MINENSRRTQDEFLGFGNNFIHNLINYRDQDDDNSKSKLLAWLKNCRNSDRICFLDITVFDDGKNIENATTILFTTSKRHTDQYKRRLYEYTSEGFAIAAHPSFFSGLQDITEYKIPHLLYHKFPNNDYKKYVSQSVFNVEIIDTYKNKPKTEGFIINRQKTIEEQWEKFKSIYGRAIKNNELLSLRGCSPKHLLAIPLGIKDSNENYNISACVFLGIDLTANEEMVKSIARDIVLSIVQMHGLPRAYRYGFDKGEHVGHEHSIMAFGHQVKTLAAGISGEQKKWIFPIDQLTSFVEQKIECAVTPVPNLLEALGKTIAFWSLEHDADSIGVAEKFPQNFLDIIEICRDFAQSIRLASSYSRKDMSDDYNLRELSLEADVKIEGNEVLELWTIDASKFQPKQGLKSDVSDDADEIASWIQLAGLIRFFAIALEGAIEYAPDLAQPFVSFQLHKQSNNRLNITCTNICKPEKQRRKTDSRYAGMHGLQIRQFIATKFLQSLNPYLPYPQDSDEKYSIAIELDLPPWAKKRIPS
jgi:hypothetical protein